MKTYIKHSIPFVLIAVATIIMSSYAHKGALDKRGGHIDTKDKTYHFHHGCEAHQHIDGTCKFDFKNCDREKPKEISHDHDYQIENE